MLQDMDHVTATRSELLARRGQIALAAQGRDLLTEKRTALLREFHRIGASVLERMRELQERASAGRSALGEALALDGPEGVSSAARATARDIAVELRTRNVAGVRLVELDHDPVPRSRAGRGYALSTTSARIDAAADAFERQLEGLLDLVAVELTLRRLGDEIETTTRRVNALDQVVIPRLEAERNHIAMVLEDRELENRARLMRVKSRRAAAA